MGRERGLRAGAAGSRAEENARPPRALGSGSGSGLGARGRPGLACGRPRSRDQRALRGKGLVFWGVVFISRHCPSLKLCFLGFVHKLQLFTGILGCHGDLVLGVRGDPWRGLGEPLQHLLGDGSGGCVWGWDGETKRD